MTSRADFSLNSNTPCNRRASSASSLPRCRLCSTSMRSSSGEWIASSSALVPFSPSSRTTRLALQLRRSVNGRVIHEKKRRGSAIQRLVRSGWVMAQALGACSPNTTWRKETIATATVEATPPRARNQRLDARAAGGHQREFGRHEERVREHERQHRQQAETDRFRGGAGHRGGNIERVARGRNGRISWGL